MANGDVVQSSGKRRLGTVSSDNFSFATQPTVGNTIVTVASVWSSGGSNVLTVSDNQSNTYDNAGKVTASSSDVRVSIVIAPITTSSGTFTTTASFSGSCDGSWVTFEVEGILTTSPKDKSSTNTSGSAVTSLASGTTGTLSQASEFAVAALVANAYPDADINVVLPAGWTSQLVEDDSEIYIGGGAATLVTSATTALNPSFSFDSSDQGVAVVVVTFKLDAASTQTLTPSLFTNTNTFYSPTVTSSDTIALTDKTANKIIQRVGTSVSEVFSGTNSGETPDNIQVQLYEADGTTIAQAWTELTSATITATTWTGTLSVPEATHMYRFAARSRDSGDVVLVTSTVSTNLWGVGDNLLFNGDSDYERVTTSDSATGLTANAGVRLFDLTTEAWTAAGTVGVAITLANAWSTDQGCAVGIIEAAIGGSKVVEWGDNTPSTEYAKLTSIASAMGTGIAAAFVCMGANDASDNLTVEATYTDAYTDAYAHLRTLFGASLKILPLLTSRDDGGSNDTAFDLSKKVMFARSAAEANTLYPISGMDLAMASFHYTTVSYPELEERMYLQLDAAIGDGTYYRGAYITSFTVSASVATATVVQDGGTSLTIDGTDHGLTATDGSGDLAISSVTSPNATTLTITFGRTPSGTVLLSYGRGAAPYAAGEGINDNTTETIPMEFLYDLAGVPVTQTLTPSLFTNTNTFYAPTVSAGVVNLSPSLYTNTQSFYAPTVTVGAVELTPDLFTNTQTFFSPVVTQEGGAQFLTPDLFTNTNTFYSPSVTAGVVNLTPALFTNTQIFYAPTVALVSYEQTLLPELFVNENVFYPPTITGGEHAVDLGDTHDGFWAKQWRKKKKKKFEPESVEEVIKFVKKEVKANSRKPNVVNNKELYKYYDLPSLDEQIQVAEQLMAIYEQRLDDEEDQEVLAMIGQI